jgi:hypothetical protein
MLLVDAGLYLGQAMLRPGVVLATALSVVGCVQHRITPNVVPATRSSMSSVRYPLTKAHDALLSRRGLLRHGRSLHCLTTIEFPANNRGDSARPIHA